MKHYSNLFVDKRVRISKVDDRLFSSFIEHLGRAVYGGIYEPDSPNADTDGFRKDVISLVKEISVPLVRYPGGNFVSGYNWEDGIGDRAKRSKRIDLAWRTIEPNLVGIDEFAIWADKANTDIMMAVNLGTRGISEAVALLEYCNIERGSCYSDLRKANGHSKPYGIKTWCLGNEMDGKWQTGHKTAHEYGRLAAETGRAMKMLDHGIELVACGSSNSRIATFPEWEREVLTETYDEVDYISMHQYFGKTEDGTPTFLANNIEMDRFISSVVSTMDYVKAVKRSSKSMMISFDEWNVWYHNKKKDNEIMENSAWTIAPSLLEDIYNQEDALLVGSMLITLLKHADRVKIACLAQLVNVIAPIMVSDGKAWRQTIFYPYKMVSLMSRGCDVLYPIVSGTSYSTPSYESVPVIDSVALYDEEHNKVVVFAVNKNLEGNTDFSIDLSSFDFVDNVIQMEMTAPLDATNGPNAETVAPCIANTFRIEGKLVKGELKPASWNTFDIEVR